MTIIARRRYAGKSRRGTSFKDGTFIRAVEIHDGNEIQFVSTEGEVLYRNRDLPSDFAVQEITAQTSSVGTPHIVLHVYGFMPGDDQQECVIVGCDGYVVTPPEF